MELPSISYGSNEQQTWFYKNRESNTLRHNASPLFDLDILCVCNDM